jgi:hypothetical protein
LNIFDTSFLTDSFNIKFYTMQNDKSRMSDKVSLNAGKGINDTLVMNDSGKVVYNMLLTLRDEFGNIKEERRWKNTVATAGKNGAADQILASPSLNKPTHMAIGTGTGGTTSLTTELDRNALTSKTRSNAVVTMVGDWAAGDGTGAITEAGIFDAASTGNMWCYASFSVINKGATDTLSISWTLTFA